MRAEKIFTWSKNKIMSTMITLMKKEGFENFSKTLFIRKMIRIMYGFFNAYF